VKGSIEKTRSFLGRSGFFIAACGRQGSMRNRIWHRFETLNLRIFFSISFGTHLVALSILTLLFPGFKIDRIPPLHVEVSLLPTVMPVVSEEKPKLKAISPPPVRSEMKKEEGESLLSLPQNIPLEEPRSDPLENGKPEMGNKKEEKAEKEIVTTAMPLVSSSDDGNWLHLKETPSEGTNLSVSLTPSSSEQLKDAPFSDIGPHEESRSVAKLSPPLSESMIFVRPKYAENPKPVYPQEARRRGYEGEVLLRVEVLANGRVGRLEVKKSSGYEILDRSALTAVKQWKFIPANEGNGTIPCWVNIPIKFQLQ